MFALPNCGFITVVPLCGFCASFLQLIGDRPAKQLIGSPGERRLLRFVRFQNTPIVMRRFTINQLFEHFANQTNLFLLVSLLLVASFNYKHEIWFGLEQTCIKLPRSAG